ncbi:hypothetical protein EV715DRAFT_297839 [Schizophyllum commune]
MPPGLPCWSFLLPGPVLHGRGKAARRLGIGDEEPLLLLRARDSCLRGMAIHPHANACRAVRERALASGVSRDVLVEDDGGTARSGKARERSCLKRESAAVPARAGQLFAAAHPTLVSSLRMDDGVRRV